LRGNDHESILDGGEGNPSGRVISPHRSGSTRRTAALAIGSANAMTDVLTHHGRSEIIRSGLDVACAVVHRGSAAPRRSFAAERPQRLVDGIQMLANGGQFLEGDPLWYKDAVIYQLHVKSFFDTADDGIGDFNGLTAKLDYLESLGVTAVWLLPFYPSPLRDDGYDIAEHFGIHPAYGTLRDFKVFLKEAHRRGIRVITELVLNHTSDQHEWFQKSRRAAPGSHWRDFYVWSSTSDRYGDARIIFKDFETSNWSWDPIANAYYWHRFYSHQPDLNFENPRVHAAMFKVIDHWLGMGVDGMRLDAAPYLYEQEGTNCENLPQTFAFLKKLRSHVDKHFKDRLLLAEANQWPEDAAAYFGSGDICQMAFHFPLMPRMFMAVRQEDRFPIVDILEQTPQIPDSAQWAIFLRNHDELTLEMVTDEEREFMYRSYAHDPSERINLGIRRRLAPLLQNSRRRIELMNILLFSLPGTPIIYYGDEIGMGDNHFLGDRGGVRTPMQWSGDRNAGFSRATPQRLYLPVIIDPEYHYETVNVENEERNVSSLLWWMRRAIATRRKYRAFARGSFDFVRSNNASVITFIRKIGDEVILVVVNLSRFCQVVNIDLHDYAGYTPRDVFSSNRFPRISERPYVLTMGFHDYFWLELRKERSADLLSETYHPPDVRTAEHWTAVVNGISDDMLETSVLPAYLEQRTTAGCRNRQIAEVKVLDRVLLEKEAFQAVILFIRISYVSGEPDIIGLPLSADTEEQVNRIIGHDKGLVMMAVLTGTNRGLVYDCAYHPAFHALLLRVTTSRSAVHGAGGALVGSATLALRRLLEEVPTLPQPVSVVKTGKRNTAFSYDNRLHFKLFRRLEEGVNPDVELQRHLSAEGSLAHNVATFFGSVDYEVADGTCFELGMLTSYVHNTGTAWNQAIDAVAIFFEDVLANRRQRTLDPAAVPGLFSANTELAATAEELLGPFVNTVKVLGARTAQMHNALSQGKAPDFDCEPFNMFYQRELFQSMRGVTKRTVNSIRERWASVPEDIRPLMQMILDKEKDVIGASGFLLKRKIDSDRSRIHGDCHLGQFIAVGNDFVIKDFEGNPSTAMSERRAKRSVLRDVASMIHSLHRASYYSLGRQVRVQQKELAALEPWSDAWSDAMGAVFLSSYLGEAQSEAILPKKHEDIVALLILFLIERAVGEVGSHLSEGKRAIDLPARALKKYLGLVGQNAV
jgi:maltose alpha-D-glucosyltransferase / alpha-amylase